MTRENAIFIVVEAQAHAQRAVKRFRTKDSSRYVMHEFLKSMVPPMFRFCKSKSIDFKPTVALNTPHDTRKTVINYFFMPSFTKSKYGILRYPLWQCIKSYYGLN